MPGVRQNAKQLEHHRGACQGRDPAGIVRWRDLDDVCPNDIEPGEPAEQTLRLASREPADLGRAGARSKRRIHTVDDLMTPARNLDTQTAVIAGARAFVGTYGGYSYLAPLCGVPALAFYSVRESFHVIHRELAERVFREMNAGSLVTLDVRDATLVRAAFGAVEVSRS